MSECVITAKCNHQFLSDTIKLIIFRLNINKIHKNYMTVTYIHKFMLSLNYTKYLLHLLTQKTN